MGVIVWALPGVIHSSRDIMDGHCIAWKDTQNITYDATIIRILLRSSHILHGVWRVIKEGIQLMVFKDGVLRGGYCSI